MESIRRSVDEVPSGTLQKIAAFLKTTQQKIWHGMQLLMAPPSNEYGDCLRCAYDSHVARQQTAWDAAYKQGKEGKQ